MLSSLPLGKEYDTVSGAQDAFNASKSSHRQHCSRLGKVTVEISNMSVGLFCSRLVREANFCCHCNGEGYTPRSASTFIASLSVSYIQFGGRRFLFGEDNTFV
ncbi:UNVERIFIED_CONTAM: hypothetical protein K2H54_057198 [Gekko kuhli]